MLDGVCLLSRSVYFLIEGPAAESEEAKVTVDPGGYMRNAGYSGNSMHEPQLALGVLK